MKTGEDMIVRGLGAYMRAIGAKLRTHKPMTAEEGAIHARNVDMPYAMMVLLRLELRDIATRVLTTPTHLGVTPAYGFIRGPRWRDAADVYKWKDEDDGGD